MRSSTHTNKPIYLADAEREIQVARDSLSAIKHLKSEQSTLFKHLRSFYSGHGYDAFKTAERMVAVMKEIPDLDYSGQSDFVLSDYFEKLKSFPVTIGWLLSSTYFINSFTASSACG